MAEPRQFEAARRFLALRRIAVVGVSRHEQDFSRAVFRALAERGYDVVGVHPGLKDVAGRPCFDTIGDVTPAPEGALVFTAPALAEAVVGGCAAAGVRHVWLHRGGGAGAGTPAAVAAATASGIELVTDVCPFMVLPGAGLPHRLHAFLRRRGLARAAAPA
jgi:uncharacterized protein